jgi:DNA repair exonuclease SbcCD ATPase subunit
MRAAGCKYLAVPYSKVEGALKGNAKRLVAEAPRGKNTAALEKQIEAVQANADALENLTFDLVEELAREKSVAARQRLSAAEADLKKLKKSLRDLRAQRDTLATASVRARLKAVEEALGPGKSVRETNEVLREAIRRIAVDPEQGLLWIQWHHSEELQDVLCVSKHKKWGDDGEARFVLPPPFMEEAAKG